MDTEPFLKELGRLMLPDHYKKDLSHQVADGCLLYRKGAYIFLAMPFSSVSKDDVRNLGARALVKSAVWTCPIIAEKGLFLVYYGPQDQWKEEAPRFQVDRTGLRTVILQSIHFVDPETGANVNSRAHWGPVKFGFCEAVIQRIEGWCDDLQLNHEEN